MNTSIRCHLLLFWIAVLIASLAAPLSAHADEKGVPDLAATAAGAPSAVPVWVEVGASLIVNALDNVLAAAANYPAPLAVTAPNGGESWYLGQARTLTWASQPEVTQVTLNLLKNDAGYRTLATSIANTGSFAWTVPGDLPLGSDYKLEVVSATDPAVKDSSDAAFSIVAPPIIVTVPKGTESWIPGTGHVIAWTSSPEISQVRITLRKGDVLYSTIKSSYSNTGSFLWTIPTTVPPGNNYQIRVLWISDLSVRGTSANFKIVPSPIHIFTPNGGETWTRGTTQSIMWATDTNIPSLKIILRKNGAGVQTLATAAPNTGAFTWLIAADTPTGAKYEIRLISTADNTVMKTSDSYFSIVAP